MSQVSGDALVNELGHRAALLGDDRGAARQRLHHGQAERLIEMDRMKQRSRITENLRPALQADRPRIMTWSPSTRGSAALAKYRSSWTMPQITSRRPARRAISRAMPAALARGW